MKCNMLSDAVLLLAGSAIGQGNGNISSGPFPDIKGSNFTYPWLVQTFNFESLANYGVFQVAFMNNGPVGDGKLNGKKAIMCHGKKFCGPTWRATIRSLSGLGYHAIAQTMSASFAWSSYGLRKAAGVIGGDDPGEVTVIGYSLSGMLASEFELQYSDLVDVLVEPVALVDPVAFYELPLQWLTYWKHVKPV